MSASGGDWGGGQGPGLGDLGSWPWGPWDLGDLRRRSSRETKWDMEGRLVAGAPKPRRGKQLKEQEIEEALGDSQHTDEEVEDTLARGGDFFAKRARASSDSSQDSPAKQPSPKKAILETPTRSSLTPEVRAPDSEKALGRRGQSYGEVLARRAAAVASADDTVTASPGVAAFCSTIGTPEAVVFPSLQPEPSAAALQGGLEEEMAAVDLQAQVRFPMEEPHTLTPSCQIGRRTILIISFSTGSCHPWGSQDIPSAFSGWI